MRKENRREPVTLSVPKDVAHVVGTYGGAQETDFAHGRVNFSREFTEWVRTTIMPRISPLDLARGLAERKKALLDEIQEIERVARTLPGVTSLDAFMPDGGEKRVVAGLRK